MGVLIFSTTDYKAYVRRWLEERPGRGRGEYRKISEHLGVSATLISQVFSGNKDLTPEQACELVDYLGLNAQEAGYFRLLVDHARAGSAKLRARLRDEIEAERKRHSKIAEVVSKDAELSAQANSIYYSNWLYTAIRNLSAVERTNNVATLADHLKITRAQVERALDFLLKEGLCVVDARGRIGPGHRRTHLGADSSLVTRHHQNWRMRAFDKMIFADEGQIFYTGVMSISKADAEWLRLELLTLIKRLSEKVADSPSETARCIGIDWFEY